MGAKPQQGFDPKIANLIRFKVNQMFGDQYGYTREDRQDAAQDLCVGVIVGMKRYDPQRASRYTFATRIINSKLITMGQHRRAKKRDRQRVSALKPEDIDLADERQNEYVVDTTLDVPDAISQLPPQWGAIATLLEKHSEQEVMALANLTRQQMRTARRHIERHFRAKGLAP